MFGLLFGCPIIGLIERAGLTRTRPFTLSVRCREVFVIGAARSHCNFGLSWGLITVVTSHGNH